MPPSGPHKNIRIPSGKETEYVEDAQGNVVHKQYGVDADIAAVVLPSASGRGRFGTGGQHGYDPASRGLDIPQNIIVCAANGMQTIAATTGRVLRNNVSRVVPPRDARGIARLKPSGGSAELSPEAAEQLGESAEAQYLSLVATKDSPAAVPPAQVTAVVAVPARHIEEDLVPAPKRTTKKRKISQRVAESAAAPAVVAPAQESQPQSVLVEIDAPFGRLKQHFSGIFRDGVCLVLYTDQRQIPSIYSLPLTVEPMKLVIKWQDKVVSCFWAGIQFTMPHVPITFTVLLIDDDNPSV